MKIGVGIQGDGELCSYTKLSCNLAQVQRPSQSLAQDSRSLLGALEDDVSEEAGQEHGLEQHEHLGGDPRELVAKDGVEPGWVRRGILYPRAFRTRYDSFVLYSKYSLVGGHECHD